MAIVRWVGKAQITAQVDSFTPANVGVGNTFSITINNKIVTFTATATTVANVTAGLVALLKASSEGEFKEITWVDNTTNILGTAATPGIPFTATSSATGGTASLTRAAVTANSSPNDLSNAKNWSGNANPIAADDVLFDAGNVSAFWNLDAFAAVAFASVTRLAGYTGTIALPEYNTRGNYFEYRATEFAALSALWNLEQPSTDQAEQIKINAGATAYTMTVRGTNKGQVNKEKLWVRGTATTNTLNMLNASIALGPVGELSSKVNTMLAVNSTVRAGLNCVLGTITNDDSLIDTLSTIATIGGHIGKKAETRIKGAAVITNGPTIADGKIVWMSSGQIPITTLGTDATMDLSQDNRTRSLAGTITMRAGATWKDPYGTTSGTLTIASDADISQLNIITAPGKTIAFS